MRFPFTIIIIIIKVNYECNSSGILQMRRWKNDEFGRQKNMLSASHCARGIFCSVKRAFIVLATLEIFYLSKPLGISPILYVRERNSIYNVVNRN